MKTSAILTSALSLFSLFIPTWADQWEACLCVDKYVSPDIDVRNWCATAQACGNKEQNFRSIQDDGWCHADGMWIDGPEFYRNCRSKGANDSCCAAGGRRSSGCYFRAKRSLEEPHRQAPELAPLSPPEIGAAPVSGNNELARRMDKREISLNCISPYGTSFKMAIIELAVTLGHGLVTFTVDQILNGDHIVNLAVTFLKDSAEVGFQRLQLVNGGLKTLNIPNGANGVVFLTA